MCGITGILRFQDQPAGDESRSLLLDRLKKMADTLDHRGPDGEGYWLNPAGSLGFADAVRLSRAAHFAGFHCGWQRLFQCPVRPLLEFRI